MAELRVGYDLDRDENAHRRRSKYFAIIFGVAFASLLITEQSATFCGIMLRTTSQIRDIHGADWRGRIGAGQ